VFSRAIKEREGTSARENESREIFALARFSLSLSLPFFFSVSSLLFSGGARNPVVGIFSTSLDAVFAEYPRVYFLFRVSCESPAARERIPHERKRRRKLTPLNVLLSNESVQAVERVREGKKENASLFNLTRVCEALRAHESDCSPRAFRVAD